MEVNIVDMGHEVKIHKDNTEQSQVQSIKLQNEVDTLNDKLNLVVNSIRVLSKSMEYMEI